MADDVQFRGPGAEPPRRRAPMNPHFFAREDDGSVRLRLRLDPADASLVEEAAADTPVMLWLHRTFKAAATRQVAHGRAAVPRLAAPQHAEGQESPQDTLATYFMTRKGYPDARPVLVEKEQGKPVWAYSYDLPGGRLELEVPWL